MKLASNPTPAININQQNLIQDKFTANIENGLYSKAVNAVSNTTTQFSHINNPDEKAADIIKGFLGKAIAAQSYAKMFSNGTHFKKLGMELPETVGKSSFSSLEHLDKISGHYLAKIKDKTPNLTLSEKSLLSKVVDAKIHLRHQSNSNLAGETLNIYSNDKLSSNSIHSGKNTYSEDKECLSNHDFVFFGLEFSGDKSLLPLNTKHTSVDFGANAYILDGQYPHGYLTLTDHFDNRIPPAFQHEHKDFISQFTTVRNEVYRDVHGDNGVHDVPIYNTKDMKLALGLHLIDFIRSSTDAGFKEFTLDKNLDAKGLDRVINFVFQPEFHIPRMVSTTNFHEVHLREISLEEAIAASNIQEISHRIKTKDDACEAMGIAIKKAKPDIADYLFSQWEFVASDTDKMASYDDTEYTLSNHSADIQILKAFLERGLIDPNKPFRKCNRGDTMLDNAIKYSNKEMISLLQEYGAVRSKALSSQTS